MKDNAFDLCGAAKFRLSHGLILAAVLGLILVFVIPPFQAADEQYHFYRAYQISEGKAISRSQDFETGDDLPRSLPELAYNFMIGVTASLGGRLSAERCTKGFAIPLNPTDRAFVAFTNPALYSPIGYLGTAAPIALGRMMNVNPLVLFYFGRLANFALAMFILFMALRLCPEFGWLILAWAMIPTNLFIRSSLSPDAVLNAAVALFMAAAVSVPINRFSIQRKTILVSSGVFICIFKLVYFPFLLAGLFMPPIASMKFPERLGVFSITALIGLGLSGFWALASKTIYNSMIIGNDAGAQFHFVLNHPIQVFNLTSTNLATFWPDYLRTMVGVIGWLDAYLPHWFTILYCMFLATIAFMQPEAHLSIRKKAIAAVIFVMVAYAIAVGIYITGMPVGAPILFGLQGRYFLPPALLLLFAISNSFVKGKWVATAMPILVLTFSCGSGAAVLFTLWWRYFGA